MLCCILGATCFRFVFTPASPQWHQDTSLVEVLEFLGAENPGHLLPDSLMKTLDIMRGKDLVLHGRTTGPDGKKTRYISKNFTCTNCHNLEREDPSLNLSDPELRLDYAMEHNLPFLQGSTFHGIVNRESWYNGDYSKQFGQKGKVAHRDLKSAIRLCASECAHGRTLENWEVDAILAYFWSLEYTLGDLGFEGEELIDLNKTAAIPTTHRSLQTFIQNRYLLKLPATFANQEASRGQSLALAGDPERGSILFKLSCLHCHQKGGNTDYVMDYSVPSFRQLKRKVFKSSNYSLYQIIRQGTATGQEPRMPHYPLERMSNQQVEDLRAYIETMAI